MNTAVITGDSSFIFSHAKTHNQTAFQTTVMQAFSQQD